MKSKKDEITKICLSHLFICKGVTFILEATPGFEPGIKVLQTHALPLGYVAWSERRGSNPRPMPWQGIALSTELLSHYFNSIILLYYIVNNLRVAKVCYLVKDFLTYLLTIRLYQRFQNNLIFELL